MTEDIRQALVKLELAVHQSIGAGIGFEEAVRLWRWSERLTNDIQARIVCGAPDYPDEEEEDEE